ncbi:MAG: hypothetical protein HY645_14225 [Acidobacteria bacterium]|nr:hypothetical protein [Acidobacteriota bacterium]
MSALEIPEVRLEEGGGVTFRYLAFEISCREGIRPVLRAVNYRSYEPSQENSIMRMLESELSSPQETPYRIMGGGSLTLNNYEQTITIYGANPVFGAEPQREKTAAMLERSLPGYKTTWFGPDVKPATEKAPRKAAEKKQEGTEAA